MRFSTVSVILFSFASAVRAANSSSSISHSSHQILPSNFKPPQVFKNVNLLRNINLEKAYVKEFVSVVIENTDANPQHEYYIPFAASIVAQVGGLEVRDNKNPEDPPYKVELVAYDETSPTQFYRVTLTDPLKTKAQKTLAITYHLLSSLSPLPATINQQDKQYLQFTFSPYSPSAYLTQSQKTKIKFPSNDIPEYTGEPQRQGSTFTYGPYVNIAVGDEMFGTIRYEFTKPIIRATLLERDIEISHWGGNLATEERYWLTNKGASLANHFSRVSWASQQYYNPATTAIKELNVPLMVGSLNPYFTDDIGNISTSRFRSNSREALLELKPRFPIFGGWAFPFRIGWDANVKDFLRSSRGEGYVLKVPFLEGPKMSEGISYDKVILRVILPEGATNVKYEMSSPLISASISSHRTFLDTLGRTTLTLTAINVIDESRGEDLIVTYNYAYLAGFRKPITIFIGILAVFVTAWCIGSLDVSIGRKRV